MTTRRHWFVQLVATNLAASFALRTAFLLQAALMVLNNLLFFCFWWVLFSRFDEIRGWAIGDIAVLFGVAAAGHGLGIALFGGVSDLARQIDDSELDPLLTQPRSVLALAIASRTRADGWGDVASGIALIAISGRIDAATLPLVPVAIAISCLVLSAVQIVLHSSAFWFGRTTSTVRMLVEMQLTFSVYPTSLFGGAMRVVLFTVVPAGFISHLPASVLREFSWPTLGAALGGAIGFCALAIGVFARGLRRYESGNRFGAR